MSRRGFCGTADTPPSPGAAFRDGGGVNRERLTWNVEGGDVTWHADQQQDSHGHSGREVD